MGRGGKVGRNWDNGQGSHWGNQHPGLWGGAQVVPLYPYRQQGSGRGLGLCGSESQPNVATFYSWPKSGQPPSAATSQPGLRKPMASEQRPPSSQGKTHKVLPWTPACDLRPLCLLSFTPPPPIPTLVEAIHLSLLQFSCG